MTYIEPNPKSGLFITLKQEARKSSSAAHKADFLIDLEHCLESKGMIYGKICIS